MVKRVPQASDRCIRQKSSTTKPRQVYSDYKTDPVSRAQLELRPLGPSLCRQGKSQFRNASTTAADLPSPSLLSDAPCLPQYTAF